MNDSQDDQVLVISMDPGAKISFVAILVRKEILKVISWGKIPVDFTGNHLVHPVSVLCTAWEAVTIGQGASCLWGLLKLYNCRTSFVWERQRGYLDHFLGEPFVDFIRGAGYVVEIVSPSEKFYRLGVSSNKQESVKYASTYFNPICPPLADFLINHPLHETHDVADAALLGIIHLEERYGFPILDVPDLAVPSGCEVAGTLTAIYKVADVNGRKGANITRRMVVTARIAASRVQFVQTASSCSLHRLTRSFLRSLSMPVSEAADLCHFASAVVNSLKAPFVGITIDLNGVSFTLFKIKGNKKSYAAALPLDMLASFKAVMVY